MTQSRSIYGKPVLRDLTQATPTAFDRKCAELGIRSDNFAQAAKNGKLAAWVRLHHTHHFIPEEILTALGVDHRDWTDAHTYLRKSHRLIPVGFHTQD